MSAEDRRGPSSDGRTDGELVRRLRAGDSMAFELLMRRYERPLYGFIARQVGDHGHAQDLYQQTLLRVLDRIDTCTSPESFRPWAFSVASNLCRNFRRTAAQRGEVTASDLSIHPGGGPDPEQSAASNETARKIAAALAALPEAQREVFVLYHYTQLAYDEIAAATGVPLGTVKSRMNAALVQLRGLLAGLAKETP